MTAIVVELDQTLGELDTSSAAALEQLVRQALILVNSRKDRSVPKTDANGWPTGYFERTAGSFEGEPLDAPTDLPEKSIPAW